MIIQVNHVSVTKCSVKNALCLRRFHEVYICHSLSSVDIVIGDFRSIIVVSVSIYTHTTRARR